MPTYLLEFSRDDLSDTTPAWTDITNYFLEGKYERDGGGDLDEPQAGTATFALDNRDRRFEPEYVSGAYYPDIRPLRRIRLSIDGDVEFTGFVTSWGISWPDEFINEEVTVQAVDGHILLELESLLSMNPPDAESFEEVVNYYEPSFYYPMNEDAGTKLVSHLRSKRWRRRHPRRKGRYMTRETAADLGGVSGSAGTYKLNPTLGVPGFILGSDDTAVTFEAGGFASVTLDADDLTNLKGLTVGCWVVPQADGVFISGPRHTASGSSIFRLFRNAGQAGWEVLGTNSTIYDDSGFTWTIGDLHFLVGTWSPGRLRLYIDGVALDPIGSEVEGPAAVMVGNNALLLFAKNGDSGGVAASAAMAHAFVIEKELEPASVLHLWEAGAERGFAEQLAGDRIEAIATHDLWGETAIQTGAFDVQPIFQHGQSKIEEIMAAFACEGPRNHWYFNGSGDPVYLGWNFGDASPYNTVQATIGDSTGEVPYESLQLAYDDKIYNEVTVSREGGTAQIASDATSQGRYRIRRYQETGLLLSRDEDATAIAEAILDEFREPQLLIESVDLNGTDASALTQIKTLDVGFLVEVKRRPKNGTAIDRVCRIKSKSVTIPRKHGPLTCTFTLTRGFNATVSQWRLGIIGFTELGSTTVLG
jgi:hypothetical protein